MGTLVGRHYQTAMMLKLADHTYVECGTGGKAWGCWGGKTNGQVLRSGQGSTMQADAIAGPDERGGITCYLINGVCHQAANRILYPASLTVRGARGYWLSTSLFGVYGRASALFGLCKAPFDQHTGVTGDLQECLEGVRRTAAHSNEDPGEQAFLAEAVSIVERQETALASEEVTGERLALLQVEMFAAQVQHRLGPSYLESKSMPALMSLRRNVEDRQTRIDQEWADGSIEIETFVSLKNALAVDFQLELAGILDDAEYERLLDLSKADIVVLGDPEIARTAYDNNPPRKPGPRR